MNGHIIPISNNLLDPKHRKQIGGSALWEFEWLIDRMTSEKTGKVLGGRPIKLKELKKSLGIAENNISKHLNRLEKFNYINIVRAPYGLIITVNKPQKVFGQKLEPIKSLNQRKERINKTVESPNEIVESPNEIVESNIRQDTRQDKDNMAGSKLPAKEDTPLKELALGNEKDAVKPTAPLGGMGGELKLPYAGSNVTHVKMEVPKTWQELDVSWFMISLQDLPKVTAEMLEKSLAYYKAINPDYEDLYANKTERDRQTELLERYGVDKLKILIDILPDFKKQPYQKVKLITKPSHFRRSLPELLQDIIEKQGQNRHQQKAKKYYADKAKENKEGYTEEELFKDYYTQEAEANGTTVEAEQAKREAEQAKIQEAIRLGQL